MILLIFSFTKFSFMVFTTVLGIQYTTPVSYTHLDVYKRQMYYSEEENKQNKEYKMISK